MDPNSSPAAIVSNPNATFVESSFEAAYERSKARHALLAPGSLNQIVLDVTNVVATVLGVLPKLAPFREPVMRLLGDDAEAYERLEDSARALMHAHTQFQLATRPPTAVATLAESASALRSRLLADVQVLIGRGLLGQTELAEYEGGSGYKATAEDLLLLASVVQRAWPKVEGQTAIKVAEIDQAKQVADALITAVGVREQSPARVAEATAQRLFAYNLLLRDYDQVRRAVGYLRWNERDADTLAPSLFAGRASSRRRADDTRPASEPPQPSANAVEHSPEGAPQAPHTSEPDVSTGLPGESPLAG